MKIVMMIVIQVVCSFAIADQCRDAVEHLEKYFPNWEVKAADEVGYYNLAVTTLISDCKQHAEIFYKNSQIPSLIEITKKQCDKSSDQMSELYSADCYEKAAKLMSVLMAD